jgi:predicted phosphodiesterase
LKEIAESKVDHLIVTGDITDNASEKDLERFRRLLIKYNFMDGKKLSIIAGNHDIFGGVQKAEDIFNFPEKCNSTNYNERLDTFLSYFPEAFNNCYYISPKKFFPFLKKIDDTLIIGVNSIAGYSRITNPFGSNGVVDATQFGELYEILRNNNNYVSHKILITHHHFNKLKSSTKSTFGTIWSGIEKQTMKLRGKKRLFKLFNEVGVEIVLHGHVHESKEYHRKGIRFLNAGASIKNNKDYLHINYLTLSKSKIKIDIQKLAYPERMKNERGTNTKNEQLRLINAALIV